MFQWMKKFIISEETNENKNMEGDSSCNKSKVSGLDRKQWLAIVHVHEQAIKTLCQRNLGDDEICSKLEELLKSTPHIAETINLCDNNGLNLLQYTIKFDLPLTCNYLIKQGADLNSPGCNRPLHLAAKLGRSRLVTMLLDFGSDPYIASSVCYPELHGDKSTSLYNPETMTWMPACSDDSYHDFPLYYAIVSNNPECIKVLMDRKCSTINGSIPPLHIACREGKRNSATYLISRHRECIAVVDPAGYLPIQYAVKWGREFMQLLVRSGSSVMSLTKRRETLLHLLFQDVHTLSGLSDCVEYLLNCGLNMNINIVDEKGNSALMLLLKNMPKLFNKDSETTRPGGSQYAELMSSVRLLLQARCNPNICNMSGDRALHILLVCQYPMIVTHELLHLLLTSKANPNFCNTAGERPLALLCKNGYETIFSNSWQALYEGRSTCTDLLVDCIGLLSQHSGVQGESRPVCGLPSSQSPFYSLFSYVLNLRRVENLTQDRHIWLMVGQRYMECITKITKALLMAGHLPVSHHTSSRHASDLAYLYYCLITQSRFISYQLTFDLLTLMLSYGADPDVGGMTSPLSVVPQTNRQLSVAPVFPMLHLLHLYWKAGAENNNDVNTPNNESSELSCYADHQILQLFQLFYNVSSHNISSACLRSFVNVDVLHLRKLPDGMINNHRRTFLDYLNGLLTTPKSLQHQAALVTYLHLNRKTVHFLKLPLPNAIKEKLFNLDFS